MLKMKERKDCNNCNKYFNCQFYRESYPFNGEIYWKLICVECDYSWIIPTDFDFKTVNTIERRKIR